MPDGISPSDNKSGLWLRTLCRKNGLHLSDDQLTLLQAYVQELLRWNARVNLVSRRDEERIWDRHILHSIAPLFHVVLPANIRYLDLGTGGGLPGIPMKILLPQSEWVLLDATRKKIDAVNDIVRVLGLTGIRAVWGRAEDAAKDAGMARAFDVVTARGVTTLDQLVRLAHPFARGDDAGRRAAREIHLKRGGGAPLPALLAWKGGDLVSEIAKIIRRRETAAVQEIGLHTEGAGEHEMIDKKIVMVTLRPA